MLTRSSSTRMASEMHFSDHQPLPLLEERKDGDDKMIHSFDDLTDQHEPSESEDDDEQQLLQWVTGWTAALPAPWLRIADDMIASCDLFLDDDEVNEADEQELALQGIIEEALRLENQGLEPQPMQQQPSPTPSFSSSTSSSSFSPGSLASLSPASSSSSPSSASSPSTKGRPPCSRRRKAAVLTLQVAEAKQRQKEAALSDEERDRRRKRKREAERKRKALKRVAATFGLEQKALLAKATAAQKMNNNCVSSSSSPLPPPKKKQKLAAEVSGVSSDRPLTRSMVSRGFEYHYQELL
ncbi:hypothetical protein TYRP_011217 [Tyrophagus putrescentiae]|nr:hypothetical protein TYRP_011217 [Tyrophagus putrescentiae]